MIKVNQKAKTINADRLVSITAMKTTTGNKLYYHFSFNNKKEFKSFSLDIPKGETVQSLSSVFENSMIFEAEITELFGIKFEGNELSGLRLFQSE